MLDLITSQFVSFTFLCGSGGVGVAVAFGDGFGERNPNVVRFRPDSRLVFGVAGASCTCGAAVLFRVLSLAELMPLLCE